MFQNRTVFIQKYLLPLVLLVLLLCCLMLLWLKVENTQQQAYSSTTAVDTIVQSRDDAVRRYLQAAQMLAEVYAFTNNGSYSGLCEYSDEQYTLEGESGGILKYIKMVGATEVYCYTGSSDYMVEAKMPENGRFYCIDEQGDPIEQNGSREGFNSCL